tara:strand:- start:78 stop:422 length:345 start_codon:yes stop_codon:yes gene_type:complete
MPWPVYNYSTQPDAVDLVSPDLLEEITSVEDIKGVNGIESLESLETIEPIGDIINVKTDELNAIEAIDRIVNVVDDNINNVVDIQPTKLVNTIGKKWKPGDNPLRRKEFNDPRL